MTRCQIGQLCYFSSSVCLECSRAAASDQLLPVLGLLGCAIYQTVQMFAEHAEQETVLKSEDRLSGPAGRLSGPAGRLPGCVLGWLHLICMCWGGRPRSPPGGGDQVMAGQAAVASTSCGRVWEPARYCALHTSLPPPHAGPPPDRPAGGAERWQDRSALRPAALPARFNYQINFRLFIDRSA